jgi:hypothetical protein
LLTVSVFKKSPENKKGHPEKHAHSACSPVAVAIHRPIEKLPMQNLRLLLTLRRYKSVKV